MKISYFDNKSWNEITREERFFCAELYFKIKYEKDGLKNILKVCNNVLRENNINKQMQNDYDVGYEVCFYRDIKNYIKKTDKELYKKIKNSVVKFSDKRTFDLALFSKNEIHIFEAKCHEGFKTDQLNEFKKDEKNIKELLKIINVKPPKIDVYLWAIVRSNYNPHKDTKNKTKNRITFWNKITKIFNNRIIYWNQIADTYNKNEIFLLADEIKKKRNPS